MRFRSHSDQRIDSMSSGDFTDFHRVDSIIRQALDLPA